MRIIWPWVAGLLLCIISSAGCVEDSVSVNEESNIKVAGDEEKTEYHNNTNENKTQGSLSRKMVSVTRKFSHSNSKVFDPNATAAEFLADMDTTVEPCSNFYRHVCGNYKPGGYFASPRQSHFYNQAGSSMKDLLVQSSPQDEIQPLRNVKNFFQACMNTTKPLIENDLHTFKEIVSELGGWPMLEGSNWREDKFNWSDLVVKLGAIDSNFFFDSGCSEFSKCWILPAKSMFNHDELTDYPYRNHDETVNDYYDRVKKIIDRMGGDSGAIRVQFFWDFLRFDKEIFDLSKQFVKPPLPATATAYLIHKTKYTTPMEDLISRYPEIPFLDHLSATTPFTAPQVSVRRHFRIETITEFLSQLVSLVKYTSPKTLANYAMVRLAVNKIPASNSEILNKELSLNADNGLRRYKCFVWIDKSLPLARDVLYVRSHFPANAKNRAVEMIADIRAETKIYLEKIESLDNATIHKMLETIDETEVLFGYPDEFFDDDLIKKYYEGLVISSKDDFIQSYFEFYLYKLRSFKPSERLVQLNNNWKKYSKSWDRLSYAGWSQNVQVPAGFLHGSFFNLDQPNYLNYAGAGQYIGSALGILSSIHKGHAIREIDDLIGQEMHKLSCQRSQAGQIIFNESRTFEGFDPYPKTVYYQQLGMNIAFSAYKRWLGRNKGTELQLPEMDYTVEQMFWINVMHQECSSINYSGAWIFHITDLVNVMNSHGFREAFGCPNVLKNSTCPRVA